MHEHLFVFKKWIYFLNCVKFSIVLVSLIN
jgi:hypothetical protein